MSTSEVNTRSELSPDLRLRPRPRVRFRAMENEGVLLDLDRGLYFHLNATGVAIWQALETGISLGELHTRLVGEYAADCDRVWSELESLIRALLAENLLGALES